MPIAPADVEAAVRRLRGHLVATPLIGGLRLPGFPVAGDLRLKPEVLQPGGSLWYRAALHFLQRQLGRCRGLLLTGPPASLRAQALAGLQHRLPMVSFGPGLSGSELAELAALGCEHRSVPEAAADQAAREHRQRSGFTLLPLAQDPDCRLGVATLGWELARDLPAACAQVLVPPGAGSGVEAGLRAGGHAAVVREVTDAAVPSGLAAALARGHGLVAGATGLAVLAAALGLTDGPHGVVLDA